MRFLEEYTGLDKMSTEALAVVGGLLLVGGFAYYYMSSKPVPVARIETQAKPKQGHCIQLDLTFLAPKHTTQYSVEEIAKHNKADDLWIIVGTKVLRFILKIQQIGL